MNNLGGGYTCSKCGQYHRTSYVCNSVTNERIGTFCDNCRQVICICPQDKNNNLMDKLDELGWQHEYTNFISYFKKIQDYEIFVSKHVNETKWVVTLIKWDNRSSEEIIINNNATLDWVINITKLLEDAE